MMDTAALENVLEGLAAKMRTSALPAAESPWIATLSTAMTLQFEPEILEIARGLASDSRLGLSSPALLNLGPAGRLVVDCVSLARRLLFVTISFGAAAAVSQLLQFIDLNYMPVVVVHAISGVALPREVALTEELSLAPIANVPRSPELSMMLETRTLLHRAQPTAAFVRKRRERPKLLSLPPAERPANIDNGGADREIEDACRWLNLVADARPALVAYWIQLPEWLPFAADRVSSIGSRIEDPLSSRLAVLSESDVEDVLKIHKEFESQSDSTKAKLRVPLERFNQALRRARPIDQFIDLGTALEALLLERADTELSHRFALHGAWLVAEPEERLRVFETLRRIYTLRSQAVHTGKIKRPGKVIGEELNERQLLDRGFSICRKAIRVILKTGFPDWKSLVLGGPIRP